MGACESCQGAGDKNEETFDIKSKERGSLQVPENAERPPSPEQRPPMTEEEKINLAKLLKDIGGY